MTKTASQITTADRIKVGSESEYRGARVTVLAEEGKRVCIREANGDTLWVWRSQVEVKPPTR